MRACTPRPQASFPFDVWYGFHFDSVLLDRSAMNFPDHRAFLGAISPKPKPSSLQVYFW